MVTLRVVDRDGQQHTADAQEGATLMEALRELNLGVAAVCGGMCSCATCHVFIDPEWFDRLSSSQSDERELLGELAHRSPTSRLSCQVVLDESTSGMGVRIAPEE